MCYKLKIRYKLLSKCLRTNDKLTISLSDKLRPYKTDQEEIDNLYNSL